MRLNGQYVAGSLFVVSWLSMSASILERNRLHATSVRRGLRSPASFDNIQAFTVRWARMCVRRAVRRSRGHGDWRHTDGRHMQTTRECRNDITATTAAASTRCGRAGSTIDSLTPMIGRSSVTSVRDSSELLDS